MLNNIGLPGLLLILCVFPGPLIVGLIVMGAQKAVNLRHKDTGLSKNGYHGYCWTYYIFGFFVPIFRGEIGVGLIHLVFSLITFGIFQLIMPFLYNKQNFTRALTDGWEFNDSDDKVEKAKLKLNIVSKR